MSALVTLDQLERVKGAKKKELLSKRSDDQELRDLLYQALSFERKFHIKKFSIAETQELPLAGAHEKFIDLLDVLNSRTITGNAACEAVKGFLNKCNSQQQKWYSRIILKDLRCGVSVKTANDCGFDIPVFDVMLAKDGNLCKKLDTIVPQGVYVSPKLDGYRCIAISKGGNVTLHSRNGTAYDNFPDIVASLEAIGGDFILDGEIMSDDFQSMQKSAFAATRGTTIGDVKFHVFGWIDVSEWESEEFTMTTTDRVQALESFFEHEPVDDNIVMVEQNFVRRVDDIYNLEEHYLNSGYEGAMMIPASMPYYKGRKSNALLKFKRVETMDAEVLDMYEGTGRNEGRLGGLTVLQDNGNTCDVGSGFTDEDREWIWNNKDKVIGRIAELTYQEMTPDDIMRFPIFKRWRGTNSGKI
jgi:DNA ligase-1